MSSVDAPAPPDYGPLAAASEASAKYAYELGKDQLAWAKEQWASNKDVADVVIDAALGRLDKEDANAAEDRARYEAIFQPLEEQLAQDAQDFATPTRIEKEAGKAEADVAQQFEGARRAAQEKLEGFGIDPSQTRSQALDYQSRVAEAAAQASAGNQARDRVETQGRALRSEAINVGRGYPGQIAQSYGTAINSGNQGVNTGLATTGSGAATMGSAPQWQGLGNNAIGTWGNVLNQGYQNQLDAWKAENSASSGLGSALGLVGGLATKFLGFEGGGAVPPDAMPAPPRRAIPLRGQAPGVTPGGNPGVPVPPAASPTGGAATDDVSARLNVGEFIIPKDVVSFQGEKFFQNLIQKTRQMKQSVQAKPTIGRAPAGPPAIDTGRTA